MRPSWRVYGLLLAAVVSLRADCTRRQVGAVILDGENRLVSSGYNGAPSGQPGCLEDGVCPRGQKSFEELPSDSPYSDCISIHAEENAVLWARRDLRGCTIYVTDSPCHQCKKTLSAVGITEIVTPDEFSSVMKAVYGTTRTSLRKWALALTRHEKQHLQYLI